MNNLRPLASLLIATAILLTGHGLHLTLLPLRASQIGFDDTIIGLTASAYYAGFVSGCFWIPRIIARVGHIRMFAALLACCGSAILALNLTDRLEGWLLLRFVLGVMMCGAYTVIESWLTDQTPADSRGKVLAIYTFMALSAIALGQFLIKVAPAETATGFILCGILISLAMVPVSLTRSLAPAPVPSTKLSFRLLYNRSRTAFAGGLLSGVVMGSFWSLGALYAQRASGSIEFIPVFISCVILGGALAQYPIGLASDRIDRRFVLTGLGAATAISSFAMTFSNSTQWLLATGFLFGASANAIYAVSLAKAADNSEPEEFVTIGSSVLLLNALGSVMAPLLVGQLMASFGDAALFLGISGVCTLGAVYTALQPKGKTAVAIDEQTPFVAAVHETVPASFDNDPRSPEDAEDGIDPAPEMPAFAELEASYGSEELLEGAEPR